MTPYAIFVKYIPVSVAILLITTSYHIAKQQKYYFVPYRFIHKHIAQQEAYQKSLMISVCSVNITNITNITRITYFFHGHRTLHMLSRKNFETRKGLPKFSDMFRNFFLPPPPGLRDVKMSNCRPGHFHFQNASQFKI